MKFLIDMPVGASVARWLREHGHDALHASEALLDRAEDDAIVARAREEDRIIVTLDLDYPRLIALSGQASPGLILFRDEGMRPSDICQHLARLFATLPSDELSASITVVSGGTLRVRKLPV